MKFYQKVEFTGGMNMSNWKVMVGNCACRTRKLNQLPIDFVPSQEPGLCPACFIKDNPNRQTTIKRLSTLTNDEKQLLFRNFCGAHLGRGGAQTTRYQMAKFISNRRELRICRFSWKDNPDPDVIRRLLYDDIPNAKQALMRNCKDWKEIRLVPVLICKKEPTRKNSAWKKTLEAVSKWPVNPTDVKVLLFDETIIDFQAEWLNAQ